MQKIYEKKVNLYGFPLSQPSRAIHAFLLHCHIPHEYHTIDLMKKQQRSPEYLAINPNGQVPAIKDYQITLSESTAILRYLSRNNRHLVDENLYPIDIVRCARVDEILDWYHGNLRKNVMGILFNRVFAKMLGMQPEPEDKIKNYENALEENFKLIENYYMKGSQYLANNQLSVADFLLACDILSLIQAQYTFQQNYKIKEWIKKMLSLPGFLKAHESYFQMIKEQCGGMIAELTNSKFK